mmetsp:Transcript_19039/g.54616  ORF Transcript_19039/g.54616 Transcript_19039/m.54616 type:complete len:82 (-) Transcript_19039:396-641(-)
MAAISPSCAPARGYLPSPGREAKTNGAAQGGRLISTGTDTIGVRWKVSGVWGGNGNGTGSGSGSGSAGDGGMNDLTAVGVV